MGDAGTQAMGVLFQGVQVPEAHGLLVEQSHEELQRMMPPEPGHLVGGEGEGQGMAFGKHVVGVELAEDGLGDGFGYALSGRSGQKLLAVLGDNLVAGTATEGAAHPVGLGGGQRRAHRNDPAPVRAHAGSAAPSQRGHWVIAPPACPRGGGLRKPSSYGQAGRFHGLIPVPALGIASAIRPEITALRNGGWANQTEPR